MTIADDDQNPRPQKKLDKSLDAIAALRHAMEQRLAAAHKPAAESTSIKPLYQTTETPVAPPPEPSKVAFTESDPGMPEEAVVAPPEEPASAPLHHAAEPKIEPPTDIPTPVNAILPLTGYDPAEWSRIMLRIAERSQKLILDFVERTKTKPLAMPAFDPGRIMEAFAGLTNRVVSDPQRFFDVQINLWAGYINIWQTALARMSGKPTEDIVKTSPFDRRFQDQEWQNNWLFDYLKQIYLLTAQHTQNWVRRETEKLDPHIAAKIDFFTRQIVDAASPSNFWLTNPEVLRKTFETGGENIIKGLENLLHDLERGQGDLRISMTSADAFSVGETLAITPGKVVYQNNLIQLIQYAPATESVHRVPLLILPPWINKFYILDLRAKNSFVRWLVDQGYTVFVVSWVNPDQRHALVNFDDYMTDGALAAMREVRTATGEKDINVVGYCIGGTVLATALSYLNTVTEKPAGLPDVKSVTYLVTMIDFAQPGDLGVFVDEELVKVLEERMVRQGYMEAAIMANVFNLLRANDLIWSNVVNNYLLGKDPVPFDILYWNADSTNMPAVMQSFYLRSMYMGNKLVKPNGLSMKGVPIDLRNITTPTFILSAREDHIAPWKSTYASTQIYKAPITFTLASSGHIAGVVNHPGASKYGFFTNSALPVSPDEWLKGAEEHKGSWWPEWLKWLAPFAGEKVPARTIKSFIEDAPGSYVKVRAV